MSVGEQLSLGRESVGMDVQMPDIDGMEATRRIRADQRFASLMRKSLNVLAAR